MTTSTPHSELVKQHQQLIDGTAYALPEFDIISIAGEDRAKFLHSFCTANIKDMPSNSGVEAFVLNVKGKTIGFGYVVNLEQKLFFVTAKGQAENLIPHLDRYVIRDDVQISNATSDFAIWCLSESAVRKVSEKCDFEFDRFVNQAYLDNLVWSQAKTETIVINTEQFSAKDCLLISPLEFKEEMVALFSDSGLSPVSNETFNVARIENGTPVFGLDITENNLPQEIRHDERAISFTKGCYLGQETVARIDALGHVNKFLVRVTLSGDSIPGQETQLFQNEKPVGQVTSVCFSPRNSAPFALAFVKRGLEATGTNLDYENGTVTVV